MGGRNGSGGAAAEGGAGGGGGGEGGGGFPGGGEEDRKRRTGFGVRVLDTRKGGFVVGDVTEEGRRIVGRGRRRGVVVLRPPASLHDSFFLRGGDDRGDFGREMGFLGISGRHGREIGSGLNFEMKGTLVIRMVCLRPLKFQWGWKPVRSGRVWV